MVVCGLLSLKVALIGGNEYYMTIEVGGTGNYMEVTSREELV